MPLIKTISTIEGLISIWQITETLEELLAIFSPEELADNDFLRFTFEKRKCEWLATRALLKQMIGQGFEICYNNSGKPLINHPIYQHISISHSREFVAVYLHQNKAVGIDIESMNRNYAPVLKKYLSDPELTLAKENNLLQCLYWCAKEAIFKMVEEDGIDFRKQLEVLTVEPEQETLSARFVIGNLEIFYKLRYIKLIDHCMVWVSNDSEIE